MTSETQLRHNVVEILRKGGLDARPVENPIDPGFPDVEYIGGVLELKAMGSWPKRSGTPLRIDHYTKEQRIWHARRARKGGRIHVLLQVGPEFLLFEGLVASEFLGYLSEVELRSHALAIYSSLAGLRLELAKSLQEAN